MNFYGMPRASNGNREPERAECADFHGLDARLVPIEDQLIRSRLPISRPFRGALPGTLVSRSAIGWREPLFAVKPGRLTAWAT